MCKHVLNAKVVFQASCCLHWFECSECHDETNDHLFEFRKKLKMFCKTCKATFDRDLKLITVKDKHCGVCGTCWCVPGITPESIIADESSAHFGSRMDELLKAAARKL